MLLQIAVYVICLQIHIRSKGKMKEWYKKRQKDHFYREAKKNNLISRAYYKIKEINEKHKLIKNNQIILDIGCSPGGWLQYISQKYTNSKLIGIDILDLKIPKSKNIDFLKIDLNNFNEISKYFKEKKLIFDNIISDIAPNTSGIQLVDQANSFQLCEACTLFIDKFLKQKGNFLIKNFQGEDTNILFENIKKKFEKVIYIKPKASEKTSKEIYILAFFKK
ncbi:MAG: cell division protein FtsJ [Pelagibacteraceae bacterium]|nr:cell division protein FtsJ [Pelagibacteraceae bacterium]